jgi:transposase
MYVRIKTTPNSPRRSVQIVESVRDGNKVKQKIVRHVGIAMDDDELRRLQELALHIKIKLESEHMPALFAPEKLADLAVTARRMQQEQSKKPLPVDLSELREEQRFITGIHDIYGRIYEELGFSNVFASPKRNQAMGQMLRDIVLARIANPLSKRGSVAMLERDFGIGLNLDRVYQMMSKIDDKTIQRIQDRAYGATRSLLGQKIDVLFYDCTTLYFESFNEDDLKQYGYSKDFKFNQSQVLLALLVTPEGLPVGYEVFPGARFEGHTLIPVLKNIKARYELNNVIFVADRGLLSEENLNFLDQEKFHYIVGARLRNLSRTLKEKILDEKNYKASMDEEGGRYASFDRGNGRKLIVNYNLKRAQKDRHDRERAVEKLLSKLQKNKNAKNLISNYGYKKYIRVEGESNALVDHQKVAQASKWDGLMGIITNKTEMPAEDVLAHYHSLWHIEESFRIHKHDLKIRPIFHWTPPRIRAHIAISFMAFTCVRYLEYRVSLQYQKMSPEAIRKELLHVQMSYLKHCKTKKAYCIPSKINQHAKKIYQLMALKYSATPFQLG